MPTTLGYGDIHGLAHAICLLLEYTDSSYKEKKYMTGDSPNYDRSQYLHEKFQLGLDFPNLPYLFDGAHKITQSNAILCHIARKHNLCGETEEEKIRVDILENQSMDNLMQLAMICYIPEFEKVKPKYLEELPEKLTLYSQFLGKRPWFAGDEITFVDFLAYDILDLNCIFEPSCLDVFPNLKDFISRFEGLKKISAYMKSSQCFQCPLFGKSAMPGSLENTGEQPDSLNQASSFFLLSTLFFSPQASLASFLLT
ncbi:PREDICTED: glutathione S-transferase Mu 1-like [Mandrillus leucophaeus]|uniref:glutathione S-transferase Mu 1-like n=1 Tax=Mandrillus leucophaeus TaxID=9568 RepID=UPI0005F4F366|nr:PREDICTED: glutathione S-transferase Mu 1-like [Mandrillus leucophaeus]